MSRLLLAFLLIIIAAAQSTVLAPAGLLGIAPNLVLVLVLLLGSRFGAREGVVWAFGCGFMLDVMALDPLGSNALALIPVAVIGALTQRPLLQSGLLFTMLMVLIATIAHFLVASAVDAMVSDGYSLLVSIRLGLVTSLLNMFTVPPLYAVVVLLDRLGVPRVAQA